MPRAYLNRIGSAVPPHDVHRAFIDYTLSTLPDERARRVLERMTERAGIEHRYSHLKPKPGPAVDGDEDGFYRRGAFPGTAARMARFERDALDLARRAVADLDLGDDAAGITHLVLASCTGFTAPGLDQQLAAAAGLDPAIERTIVGFMGCSAAVNALKLAHHIVRSDPLAKVLVVNCELCTLHMQAEAELSEALASLLFGDGCAAALVSAEPNGLALLDFKVAAIPATEGLITWRVADTGFLMHLSGEVPFQIATALRREAARDGGGIFAQTRPEAVELWAVHAGGRTVLDAVEDGLGLAPDALSPSRGVLRDFGNMSSATLMFVLQRILASTRREAQGFGMAFGPGMVAETFRFRTVGR